MSEKNEAAERLRSRVLQGSEDENALLDEALAAERRATVERIRERIERITELQPKAVGYIRRYGFVFDTVGPLTEDGDELTRWKVLAFSLYTDLCEAEQIGRAILDEAVTA